MADEIDDSCASTHTLRCTLARGHDDPHTAFRTRVSWTGDVDATARLREPEWRCFHCDEIFTTPGSARDHFGGAEGADPGCLIDRVALEEGGTPERGRGLLMALRKAEDRIAALQRENEELENDSRLWHESEADRIRRIGDVQWWQELDFREGEKLVAKEWIAALESALSPLRSTPQEGTTDEWQPIESAPKDGTVILAWREGWVKPTLLLWLAHRDLDGSGWCPYERQPIRPKGSFPTHWMPLHPTPADERVKVAALRALQTIEETTTDERSYASPSPVTEGPTGSSRPQPKGSEQ